MMSLGGSRQIRKITLIYYMVSLGHMKEKPKITLMSLGQRMQIKKITMVCLLGLNMQKKEY